MLQKRDLQLVRLAVRRRWISAEEAEDCLFLKRRFGDKYPIEELIRRRGYLDDRAIDELSKETDRLLRGRLRRAPDRASTLQRSQLRKESQRPSGLKQSLQDANQETVIDPDALSQLRESELLDGPLVSMPAILPPEVQPVPLAEDEQTQIGIFPEFEGDMVTELFARVDPAILENPTLPPPPPKPNQAARRSSAPISLGTAAALVEEDAPLEGDFGPYRIRRLIGRGSLGAVYLAEPKAGGAPLALKVLHRAVAASPAAFERFRREAAAAAAIDSPHVVPVLGFGTEAGRHYLALRYIDGWTLKERLDAGEAPDLLETVRIAKDVAAALTSAEQAHLIHRDVKPENILISREGQVYLTDFGLARSRTANSGLTHAAGKLIGTPSYMAPEQVLGHEIDHRADLYALGATLFHVLAGRPPFLAPSSVAVLGMHLKEVPPDLALFAKDVPPALAELVNRCLAKRPADRYSSASEVERDLDGILTSLRRTRARPTEAPAKGGVGGNAFFVSSVLIAFLVGGTAFLRRSGFVPWDRSTVLETSALIGSLGAAVALLFLAALALVRRGQLPLPGSSAWIVNLKDMSGAGSAAVIMSSALLGPPALLGLSNLALGALALSSWVYGFLLRRWVAARRSDRGVGRALAVLGDPLLLRWARVHVPLLTTLVLISGFRVAFLAYFRVR